MATKTRTKAEPAAQERDAKSFAIEAAKLAADTRCVNVVLLDVNGLSPVTDYFIIATGTSNRQMAAVADSIEEMARPLGHKPISRSVDDHWILLDFVDVVVHVFSDEARHFYDLESLWGEGKRIDWK